MIEIELSESHLEDHQYPNKPRTDPVAIYSAVDYTWLARLEHRPMDTQAISGRVMRPPILG